LPGCTRDAGVPVHEFITHGAHHLMKYPEPFHDPSFSRMGVTVSTAPSLF
jgi:hypothetical protein